MDNVLMAHIVIDHGVGVGDNFYVTVDNDPTTRKGFGNYNLALFHAIYILSSYGKIDA